MRKDILNGQKSPDKAPPRHIFIIGAKCIGQYGGFESFLDNLLLVHQTEKTIQYHIVTTANGDKAMDESKLSGITDVITGVNGKVRSFTYRNAHVVKLKVLRIGAAQAVEYDIRAFNWCLSYISDRHIKAPIIYTLSCRIGPVFSRLVSRAHALGAKVYVNPDGHEWKRTKWPVPVRLYWKMSEHLMVKHCDLLICDSINIEKYIKEEYASYHPNTTYIAYGADLEKSVLDDNDEQYTRWLSKYDLRPGSYYMTCGRFVRENSYETMVREFMKSSTPRDFVIITTSNEALQRELEKKLHWKTDRRIKFADSVYDSELLKKIRENAWANIHGHTVGGTNPSLLEAMGATDVNLILDVEFNREVGQDAGIYWTSEENSLCRLINQADSMNEHERALLGKRAKERIRTAYRWESVGKSYLKVWENTEQDG